MRNEQIRPREAQPPVARFWDRLGPEMIASLTEPQKIAIARAVSSVTSSPRLPVDIRLSFKWFFLAIMAGPEKRGAARLKIERIQRPLFRALNLTVLFVLWGALAFTAYKLSLWLMLLSKGILHVA